MNSKSGCKEKSNWSSQILAHIWIVKQWELNNNMAFGSAKDVNTNIPDYLKLSRLKSYHHQTSLVEKFVTGMIVNSFKIHSFICK